MDHVDWYLLKDTVARDFIIESIKTAVNNNTINTTGLHLTDRGKRLFWKSADWGAVGRGGHKDRVRGQWRICEVADAGRKQCYLNPRLAAWSEALAAERCKETKKRQRKRAKSEVTRLYYHVEEVELAEPVARQNEQLSKFIHFNSTQYLQVKFLLCEEPLMFYVSLKKRNILEQLVQYCNRTCVWQALRVKLTKQPSFTRGNWFCHPPEWQVIDLAGNWSWKCEPVIMFHFLLIV